MLLAGLGILLGACAKGEFQTFDKPGQVLPQAEYQILGKTKYDQAWVDKTIEAEVAGFGMKRPQARPASLGGVTKAKPVARAKILKSVPVVSAPSHSGGIVLPAPHPSAPAREDPVLEPEKPAPLVATPAKKKSVTQRLRDDLEAAKVRIRKLEGR